MEDNYINNYISEILSDYNLDYNDAVAIIEDIKNILYNSGENSVLFWTGFENERNTSNR